MTNGLFPDVAASYKDNYDYFVGNETDCSRISHLAGSLMMIATGIIGIMVAAQDFSSNATKWTLIGLGVGYLTIKLLGKDLHARRADLLTSALIASLLITLGALGSAEVFTSTQLGFATFGVSVFAACITVGIMMGTKRFCARPQIP